MTHIFFEFIFYPSCERDLKNGRVKSKIGNRLWNSLLVRTAVLDQTLLAKLKQSRIGPSLLAFEIIFNNNFVFCMMSSFCSMARLAGWILTRKVSKCTNVLYPVCLKKYWIDICDGFYFVKVARLHTTAYLKWVRYLVGNLRKVLIGVWKDNKN